MPRRVLAHADRDHKTHTTAFEVQKSIDPDVIVSDDDERVLRTAIASGPRAIRWRGFKSTAKDVDRSRGFRDGQAPFFEIRGGDILCDSFVGGIVAAPGDRDAGADNTGDRVAESTAGSLRDGKGSQSISRPGFARLARHFTQRRFFSRDHVTRTAGS